MTLEELDALEPDEIRVGYLQSRNGYELKGHESAAFVHGWKNGQVDFHGAEPDESQRELARLYVKRVLS